MSDTLLWTTLKLNYGIDLERFKHRKGHSLISDIEMERASDHYKPIKT